MSQTQQVERARRGIDFINKASRRAAQTRAHIEQRAYDDAIQAAEEGIEFLAKAVLLLLGREQPRDHTVGEEKFKDAMVALPDVAKAHNFARLYMLHLFWSTFRERSKYGHDIISASPERLFTKVEADLALSHLEEWQGGVAAVRSGVRADEVAAT